MRAVRAQHFLKLLKRVIDFALPEKYGTESIYRIGKVQHKLQGLFVLLTCRRKIAAREPDVAKVVIGLIAGMIDLDRFAECLLGVVQLHRLEIVQAETYIADFIVRIGR